MIDEDDFWSNWWNEIWQGKLKYSEKTYTSATLITSDMKHEDGQARLACHLFRLAQRTRRERQANVNVTSTVLTTEGDMSKRT
jgi:hypothetical protein